MAYSYPWTPAQDAMIRQVYEAGERGGNKRLAARFGVRQHLVSDRAAQLGLPSLICTQRRGVESRWREAEIALVRAHLGEPTVQIRARLYREGYARSLSSIRNLILKRRGRGEWPRRADQVEDGDGLTIVALCAGLGVCAQTVEAWIAKGWLRACRFGGDGLRMVYWADLNRFLIDYAGHWDHRRADRWFLIDALSYRAPPPAPRKKAA